MSATRTAVQTPSPVYPLPRQIDLTGQQVPLASAVIVEPHDPYGQFACELLHRWIADEFLVNLPIVRSAPAAALPIVLGSVSSISEHPGDLAVPDEPEGYALKITPDGILAAGRDQQGTLYAVATIMQLLSMRDGQLTVAAGTVRDWPYRPIRYVHLYVPGKKHLDFFKRYVRDFLLRFKFNGIIMEVGGGVRLTRHPEIATTWRRTVMELYAHGDQVWKTGESCPLGPDNRFQDTTHHGIADGGYIEPEDLRDIVAFARAHGQEVVPEIQALSHVYHLVNAHRDIAELSEALFPDAYCPCNEKSYTLLFEVMDEYIELMDARTVHIGHDEWRAGGLCPQCRDKNTGDLFAQDVIRIYRHLDEKGIKAWMWGDHFVSGHNETGRSMGKGGPVWYDHPSTQGAWQQVKQACPNLVLLNWSWALKRDGATTQGQFDQELRDKGFVFLYGNFNGPGFENWPQRSQQHQVLGGEISSWCTMEEFQIGKMHIPMALASINLLWSVHYPDQADWMRHVIARLPEVARQLKGTAQPPIRIAPPRYHLVDLSGLFNAPLKGDAWDLSGLTRGTIRADGVDFRLGDGAILVRRMHQQRPDLPHEITIPLTGQFAALVFVQSSIGKARRPVHAGDGTFFPHESSELLGVYEIVYADGLTLSAQIRAAENVGAWNAGINGIYYHALNIETGTLPDGSPLIVWGNPWINPRPDEPIAHLRFRGTAGPSDAQPMLLAITAIEKDQLSDYRKT